MHVQTRWIQAKGLEPWNPLQKTETLYTGLPGGYSMFYYDQVPNITHLMGSDQSYSSVLPYALLGLLVGAGAAYYLHRNR